MSTQRERPATFAAVLRHREFRSLWLAGLQSVAGDQLARVALSVLVFDRTESAGLTALTYALTYLPDLVSGPLLGGLADRYPRRRVMVAADVTRAVLVAMMAVPGVPLVVLAGLLVGVQMFAAPFAAAQNATLRAALDDAHLPVALAVRQTTDQLGQLLGFAVGGALVAFLGVHTALAIDAATFVVSAILIQLGVRSRPAPAAEPGDPDSHVARIREGAQVVWRDPTLRVIAGLAWLAAFIVVPEGLMVPYAAELGGGPAVAGWLLAAFPAGFIVGALLVGRLVPLAQQQRLMGILAVGAMLPLLVFVVRPPVPVAIPLLALSGACGVYQLAALATFSTLVPDRWRGQAYGWVGSVLIGVQGLGLVAGGALTQAIGSAGEAIAVTGATGLLLGLWLARGWRRHRPSPGPAPPSPLSSPGQTATGPSGPNNSSSSTEPGQTT